MNWKDVMVLAKGFWLPEDNWDFCGVTCGQEFGHKSTKKNPHRPHKNVLSYYWRKEDDLKLIFLAEKFDCDWEKISKFFKDKTQRQVETRWLNKLNPKLKDEEWTQEEDEAVKFLAEEFRFDWVKIAEHIDGRSPDAIKKRFYSVVVDMMSMRKSSFISEPRDSQKDVYRINNRIKDWEHDAKVTLEKIRSLEKSLIKIND